MEDNEPSLATLGEVARLLACPEHRPGHWQQVAAGIARRRGMGRPACKK